MLVTAGYASPMRIKFTELFGQFINVGSAIRLQVSGSTIIIIIIIDMINRFKCMREAKNLTK